MTAKLLTVQQATKQARRHVDKIMPGVVATVESRLSADPQTLESTVVTTITFPQGQAGRTGLALMLETLPGFRARTVADSSIVLTRGRS